MTAPGNFVSLLRVAGLVVALGAGSVGLAHAQSTSIIVRPPVGAQDRGTPPSLQEYPLIDRLLGPGGAIFPGYVSPNGDKGETELAYLTGGGEGRLVFAAATVDRFCQMEQAPEITVLQPPQGGRLSFELGTFTARRPDAGPHRCLGKQVEGWRVFYSGRAPRGGTSATLRVAYPHKGLSYTHVVAIPGR